MLNLFRMSIENGLCVRKGNGNGRGVQNEYQEQIYAKYLKMSNSQSQTSKQIQNSQIQNLPAVPHLKASQDQRREEGRNPLHTLHLHAHPATLMPNSHNQQHQDVLTQKIKHSSKPQKQQYLSEEEAKDPPMNDDSKKQANQNYHQFMKKSSKNFGCNCLKSKCTKNYCQCFTQARKCNELCKCTGCQNQGEVQKRYRPNIEAEEGQKFCNCKKSNCLKKYCECYNNRLKCNSNCKCEQCKNSADVVMNGELEDMKQEIKHEKSAKQIEEIHTKIEDLSKMVSKQHHQYIFSFLEYWLS